MSLVTVSASQLMSYNGSETTFKMRFEPSATFVESLGSTILGGSDTTEDYLEVACTVDAALNIISHVGFQIHATANALSNPKRAAYKVSLYNGSNGKFYKTIYKRLYVPAITPTTFGALQAYSNSSAALAPATYYTKAEIDALLAGLVSMAVKATENTYGVGRLNVPAVLASDPIFVGPNDPLFAGIGGGGSGSVNTTVIYRDTAETLASDLALAANGELRFSAEEEIDVTTVLRSNVGVSVEGLGCFDIDAGITLTIENPINLPSKKLNKGLGKLVVRGPQLDMTWWTGQQITTKATVAVTNIATSITVESSAYLGTAPYTVVMDVEQMRVTAVVGNVLTVTRGYNGTTAAAHGLNGKVSLVKPLTQVMWDGIMESAFWSGGSIVEAPSGHWQVPATGNLTPVSGIVIKGSGGEPNALGGTIFLIDTNSINGFVINSGLNDVHFEDCTFGMFGTTGTVAVNVTDVGGSCNHISFSKCKFHFGGWGVKTTNVNFFVIGLVIDHCYFIGQASACFESGISNSSYSLTNSDFTPAPNGTADAVSLNYSGITAMKGCTFNGVNLATRCIHTTITAIDTTGGATHDLITATGHGCTIGELEPITIYNATPANLPGGYTNKEKLYFRAISANTGYAYRAPDDAFSASEATLRKDFTSAGTGTNIMRTTVPVTTDRPRAAIHIQNTFYGMSIENCQDEGFPYSILLENTFENRLGIHIHGGTLIQGLVYLKTLTKIVSESNYYLAGAFKDYKSALYSSQNLVYSRGDSVYWYASYADSVDLAGAFIDMGTTSQDFNKPSIFNFVGASRAYTEENSDLSLNKYGAPGRTVLGASWNQLLDPIHEFVRDKDVAVTKPLVRRGVKEAYEDAASKYYEDFYLDDLPVPFYPWMKGWQETRSHGTQPYQKQGFYHAGHHANRGRVVNVLNELIASVANVTTVDGSAAEHYYFAALNEDTTINMSAVAGQEVVQVERKTFTIPATTTCRTVGWGSGFYKYGTGGFQTGNIPGYWKINFISFSGSPLMQDGPPILNTLTADGPEAAFKWRGTNGLTKQMSVNQGYLANNGTLIEYTLPEFSQVGDVTAVKGQNTGGWKILQRAGQYIQVDEGTVAGVDKTTTGVTGYLQSDAGHASVLLVCIIDNIAWAPVSSHGSFTPF